MADVVVVGAGPAGCCAAIHLARRGHQVVILELDGATGHFPHGWVLSREAVDSLAEVGALPTGGVQVTAATVRARGRHPRTFTFTPDGELTRGTGPAPSRPVGGRIVTPAQTVIDALRAAATSAGAVLRFGVDVTGPLMADGAVIGVRTREKAVEAAVHSRVVVAADGAAGSLGSRAGLGRAPGGAGRGYAVHTLVTGIDPATVLGPDRMRLDLPLADPTDRWVLPSCGWLLPTGPRSLTAGVALFEDGDPQRCATVLERYLALLREDLPGLRGAHTGRPRGGGVRLDLDPARSATRGLLLVGDAAGLSSAFTAEGVSAALESGKLAASAVNAALTADPSGAPPNLDTYGRTLGSRFGAYTASGRHAVHRYQLAWRVLQSTFDDDRPLFTLTRRAALFPEAARPEALLDSLPPTPPDLARTLRRELIGVGEVVATTLQEQWPLFVRAPGVDRDLASLRLRPSALLLVTRHVGDQQRTTVPDVDTLAAALGAAVDLGALSAVAVDSTADTTPPHRHDDEVPWGNRFAVLVADVLMAKAYTLSSRAGPAAVDLFGEALAVACAGRIRDVRGTSPGAGPDAAMFAEMAALSFELPCRLGALLAGASPQVVEALRRYGRHLGVAWTAAEELRRHHGRAHPWLPARGTIAPDPAALTDLVTTNARAASHALRGVPDGTPRTLLRALAAQVSASADR